MSGKRFQNVNTVEFQEMWRNQRSAEVASSYLGKGPPEIPGSPLKPKIDLEPEKTPTVKDKNETYPPIVTIDGRVDTDIDHLIEDLADDYTGPVDEIPSKFPKPHVFSVIEGSLDDDVDSYANDDGTMEHTLIDAPKILTPSDLKDVASSDVSRKPPSHSTAGQIPGSHTDRSHNKMSENEGSCDQRREGEEDGSLLSKDHSREQLKRDHSDNEKSTSENLKKQRSKKMDDTKRASDTEVQGATQKNSACGSFKTSKSKSDPAGRDGDLYKRQLDDSEMEYSLNSRALVAVKCDSTAHASDARECCSSVKDCRSKDTESALFMQAYTESLTCTFTDESLRESHVSFDLSVLRIDQDQSQSVSESESETDGRSTSRHGPQRTREMCSRMGDTLEHQSEHKPRHHPPYSEESMTKSSDMYHRSKHTTQPNSHVSSSLAQQSHKQTHHSKDLTNTSDTTKMFQRGRLVPNPTVFSDDRPGEDLTIGSTPESALADVGTEQEETKVILQDSTNRSQSASRSSSLQLAYKVGNNRTSATESAAEGQPGNVQTYEQRIKQEASSGEQSPQKKKLMQSFVRSAETMTQHTAREEYDHMQMYRNVHPDEQQVNNRKGARWANGNCPNPAVEATKKTNTCDKVVSPSREHGVQVNIEQEDNKVEAMGEFTEQVQLPTRERRYRPGRAHISVKCKKRQELSSKTSCRTGHDSDTESLDSESQHLLNQLQMAQATKRKTNILLKHVHEILGQPDQSKENVSEAVSSRHSSKTAEHEMSRHSSKTAEHEMSRHSSKTAEHEMSRHSSKTAEHEMSRHSSKTAEHETNRHSNNEDKAHRRISMDRSTGTAVRHDGDLKKMDREELSSTGRERKIPELPRPETGDRGFVQTLVSTWDRNHKGLTGEMMSRRFTPATGPQLNKGTINTWDSKGRLEAVLSPGVYEIKTAKIHENHHSSMTHGIRYEGKHQRGSSYEKMQRSQKNVTIDHGCGTMPGPRPHKTYASTSSGSDSSDYLDDFTEFNLARSQAASKSARDDAVDKRAASVPRKMRNYADNKRRASPDMSSCRDSQKCKRRSEMDAKRNHVRSSSIKDSLRAVFKVAEESMSAAARVAEALNVVMKASQISPFSCSSTEGKRMFRNTTEHISPVLRSKRVNSIVADRVKSRSVNDHMSSKQSTDYHYTQQEILPRSRAGQDDRNSERADRKKRSSRVHSGSRDQSCGQNTSLSSPSRRDTISRNPKNIRTTHRQRDVKIAGAEFKWSPSQSSATLTQYSPQPWVDVSPASREDHGQEVSNEEQIIVEFAYSSPPGDIPAQCRKETIQGPLASKRRSIQDSNTKEGLNCLKQGTTSVNSCQSQNISKSRISEAHQKTENSKHSSHDHPSEMPDYEQTSKLTLSTEEWTIPSSCCSCTRKMDSYFTQVPPVIDQNLQSISLSAKQIIRRQLIGSCVDPGLTDSTGSDSVEYNSNFNRSIAGKQLQLSMSHKTEQHTETRLDTFVMNKCSEELDLSQSSDRVLLWQQSASWQLEDGSFPFEMNVFRPPDRGKDSNTESTETAYCCLSRSHCTNRRGSLHRLEESRASYQLHEEDIVETGDYFESSSLKKGVPEYEVSLCYTDDMSSVSSSFIDLQDLNKMFPGIQEDERKVSRLAGQIHEPHKSPVTTSYRHCDQNNGSAQEIEVEQQPSPDTSCKEQLQSVECPTRDQSGPVPKPRTWKLQVAEGEAFAAPGKSSKVHKFSPIYEELWSEEENSSMFEICHVSPNFVRRVHNTNSNNINNTNNNNIISVEGDRSRKTDPATLHAYVVLEFNYIQCAPDGLAAAVAAGHSSGQTDLAVSALHRVLNKAWNCTRRQVRDAARLSCPATVSRERILPRACEVKNSNMRQDPSGCHVVLITTGSSSISKT